MLKQISQFFFKINYAKKELSFSLRNRPSWYRLLSRENYIPLNEDEVWISLDETKTYRQEDLLSYDFWQYLHLYGALEMGPEEDWVVSLVLYPVEPWIGFPETFTELGGFQETSNPLSLLIWFAFVFSFGMLIWSRSWKPTNKF